MSFDWIRREVLKAKEAQAATSSIMLDKVTDIQVSMLEEIKEMSKRVDFLSDAYNELETLKTKFTALSKELSDSTDSLMKIVTDPEVYNR